MPTPKKSLTERIAARIEVFNDMLRVHIMHMDALLDRMDIPEHNVKNVALIEEYFHQRK